jgi:deoxycytidylate deaminase
MVYMISCGRSRNATESKKHAFCIHLARKTAMLSSHFHRHGCVIYMPSLRTYVVGFNHETATTRGYSRTVHAEMHACFRAPKFALRGAVMYVVRLTQSGHRMTYSEPCKECAKRIVKFGIAKVFYSVHDHSSWS